MIKMKELSNPCISTAGAAWRLVEHMHCSEAKKPDLAE
jgi:hypothetical protein